MQAETRTEGQGEPEPLEDGLRKIKMGVEEAEEEQRCGKVRIFISDKATALMEKRLKDKGFIVERGFNKFISFFT